MNDTLFTGSVRRPELADVIKPLAGLLADNAADYTRGRDRPPADPLGRAGLPQRRDRLNDRLLELCQRLWTAGGETISGVRLVEELDLHDTRALRLLVAYGHVHHRIRQIVGVPGAGYLWGDCRAGAYRQAGAMSKRMGLCFLFNAALYSKKPPAVMAAQMVLDLGRSDSDRRPGEKDKGNDELDAWLAAEKVTPGDVIDALVAEMQRTPDGLTALADIGRRHAEVLVSAEAIDDVLARLDDARAMLAATKKSA